MARCRLIVLDAAGSRLKLDLKTGPLTAAATFGTNVMQETSRLCHGLRRI